MEAEVEAVNPKLAVVAAGDRKLLFDGSTIFPIPVAENLADRVNLRGETFPQVNRSHMTADDERALAGPD